MKPIAIAIHAMLGLAFATGCSTPGTPVPQVKPIETVRHGGDQADGYYQLGRFMQRQGRLPQAIDALSKAIAIDPRHAEARNELGTAFASAGDLSRAEAEFEAAVAIDPAMARYWNNLGYARYLQGQPAEAVAAFDKAVALDSSSSRAWNNLGMALTSLGNSARAGEAYARAGGLSVAPPPAVPPTVFASGRIRTVPAVDPAGQSERARSILIEVPTSAVLVKLAPNVFELRLNDVVVVARPASADEVDAAKGFRLEVANGNGITGLARKVGGLLADVGFSKARLTNQKPFMQPRSEIQYRDGFHSAATTLSQRIPSQPAVVLSDRLRPGTDVRLVLGREVWGDIALVPRSGSVAQMSGTVPDGPAQRN